ncbi:hypothetical protein LTR50_004400 [Elasticomyces elasticus]|nr:hypothetical protein LTR50_004400 [Elasticomyces elasticus]
MSPPRVAQAVVPPRVNQNWQDTLPPPLQIGRKAIISPPRVPQAIVPPRVNQNLQEDATKISSPVQVCRTPSSRLPGTDTSHNMFERCTEYTVEAKLNTCCTLYRSRRDGSLHVKKVRRMRKTRCRTDEVMILLEYLKPHPLIVEATTYSCVIDEGSAWCSLSMKYYAGGDLCTVLTHYDRKKLHPPEAVLLQVFIHMTEALAYLHHGLRKVPDGRYQLERPQDWTPIIHRDIKPENIFIRWNGVFDPRTLPDFVLGDFDLAFLGPRTRDWAGTPGFFPPEGVKLRDKVDVPEGARPPLMTTKSDIWTLGALMLFMATGKTAEEKLFVGLRCLAELKYDYLLANTIVDCLADDPVARPNARKLLASAVPAFQSRRDKWLEVAGEVIGEVTRETWGMESKPI